MPLFPKAVTAICGIAVCVFAATVCPAQESAPAEAAGAESAAPRYKLEFKFRPQQVLHYQVVNEQEILTKAREDSEVQKNYTKTRRHHRVTAFDEKSGTGDLELSIDWVYMRALWDKRDGIKPTPVEFQSDDPDKQPEKFRHILATVGRPWATIRFRPTGSPVKVLSSAVQAKESKSVTTETGADGALEAYLIVLPEDPVAVGEAWKEKFDVLTTDENRNRTRITIQRTYRLTGVEQGQATIELKTAILSPITNPAISAQLLLREVAGKIVFDIERGLIVSKDWSVENTVVNPIPGVSSLMKGTSHYTETLLTDQEVAELTVAGANANSKK